MTEPTKNYTTKDIGRRNLSRRAWSKAEDARLTKLYQDHKLADIAEKMGRSISSVANRRVKLGLQRTPEQQARIGNGRFGAGQVPWNAGMKGWQAGGKSVETQFKPGEKPSNTWRPVGAERTSKDGILYRKVADTGHKPTDWRAVHVIAWEARNGPLPARHIVIFKDGNRANFEPDNLQAITRADNMRRNSISRYGEDYRSAAIQLGWFKRKLNQMEKENENNE